MSYFHIYRLYSKTTLAIKLKSAQLKLFSPFTVIYSTRSFSDLADRILSKYFKAVSFIDESNFTVSASEALVENTPAYAWLYYIVFQEFANGQIHDLREINAIISNGRNRALETIMNNVEDDQLYTVQSIIDNANIVANIHNGYIRLASMDKDRINIELHGNCIGCGFARTKLQHTLSEEIYVKIKHRYKVSLVEPTIISSA